MVGLVVVVAVLFLLSSVVVVVVVVVVIVVVVAVVLLAGDALSVSPPRCRRSTSPKHVAARMERGGFKKGCMKFQSPSVQNEYGNQCVALTPLF